MTASGEVMRKQPTHAELERWYRRLLWAYPIGYRRANGEEILAMLMDSAEPGRRRPSRADVADLGRGAVRQWFRLPVGLSTMVAAVLAAVVLGAVGASAGSWLAWQANELPSNATALEITETAAGAPMTAPHVQRLDGRRDYWRAVYVSDELSLPNWTIETAQARLRAGGWTLGPVEKSIPDLYRGDERLDAVYQVFRATRDGHAVTVYALTDFTPDLAGTQLNTDVHLAVPSWEPVAILLGWLVGAVAGWLLTGWAGYRLRRRALPRRLAVLTLGLAALGLAAFPTIGLYHTLFKLTFTELGVYGTAPAYCWVVVDPPAMLVGGTLAAGLAILVLAATARQSRGLSRAARVYSTQP
ncbi:hypothetical protein ACIBSW_28550 [Actinoplanes sp. NPDC049668]|uniref:hypothetical protein n=1 Tax=unclassified Actinoplanes TaxID=2626549 RepID=UPI0033ADF1C5